MFIQCCINNMKNIAIYSAPKSPPKGQNRLGCFWTIYAEFIALPPCSFEVLITWLRLLLSLVGINWCGSETSVIYTPNTVHLVACHHNRSSVACTQHRHVESWCVLKCCFQVVSGVFPGLLRSEDMSVQFSFNKYQWVETFHLDSETLFNVWNHTVAFFHPMIRITNFTQSQAKEQKWLCFPKKIKTLDMDMDINLQLSHTREPMPD